MVETAANCLQSLLGQLDVGTPFIVSARTSRDKSSLSKVIDPSQGSCGWHRRSDAAACDGEPLPLNVVYEEIEKHIPARFPEQRGVEMVVARPAYYVDRFRKSHELRQSIFDPAQRADVAYEIGSRISLWSAGHLVYFVGEITQPVCCIPTDRNLDYTSACGKIGSVYRSFTYR